MLWSAGSPTPVRSATRERAGCGLRVAGYWLRIRRGGSHRRSAARRAVPDVRWRVGPRAERRGRRYPGVIVPAIHAITTRAILARPDFHSTARRIMQTLGARGALHLRA